LALAIGQQADTPGLKPARRAAVEAQAALLAHDVEPERRLAVPAARDLHGERCTALEAPLREEVVEGLAPMRRRLVTYLYVVELAREQRRQRGGLSAEG
jgi:hypothetical protein